MNIAQTTVHTKRDLDLRPMPAARRRNLVDTSMYPGPRFQIVLNSDDLR